MFSSSQTVFNNRKYHVAWKKNFGYGCKPPSFIVRLGFKSNSWSILNTFPMPLHSGQAPRGELKENILGSISGSDKLQFGHENFSENKCSSFCICKSTSPSDKLVLCSTLFDNLVRRFAIKTWSLRSLFFSESVSMIVSIVCLLVLIRSFSSVRSII